LVFLRFDLKFIDRSFKLEGFLSSIVLLIKDDETIKTIQPDTTGNKINSKDTSANKAIIGLAAAGG
jgi:hypothetical protein